LIAAWCAVAAPSEAAPPPLLRVDVGDGGFVSIDVRDARIEDLLREIARQTGLELVSTEPLDERVTLTLDHVTLPQALDRLLRNRSYLLVHGGPARGTDNALRNRLWILANGVANPHVTAEVDRAPLPASDPLGRIDALSAVAAGDGALLAAELTTVALGDADAVAREEAVHALGRLQGDPSARTLAHALHDPEPAVRRAAITALADARDVRALRVLAPVLSDADSSVREEAVYALADVGGKSAIALLQRALSDRDTSVREAAADALLGLDFVVR
jgi:hypothetical protein